MSDPIDVLLDEQVDWPNSMPVLGLDHYSVRHAVAAPIDLLHLLRRIHVGRVALPLSARTVAAGWTQQCFLDELRALNVRWSFTLGVALAMAESDDEEINELIRAVPLDSQIVTFAAHDREEFIRVAGGTRQSLRLLRDRLHRLLTFRGTVLFENHKDLLAEEVGDLVCGLVGSGRLEIAFDLGNQLAIPEDPLRSLRAVGEWIGMVHIKDVALWRSPDKQLHWRSVPLQWGVVPIVQCLTYLVNERPAAPWILEVSTSGSWRRVHRTVGSLRGIQIPARPDQRIDALHSRDSSSRRVIARQELRHLHGAIQFMLNCEPCRRLLSPRTW